MSRTPVMPSFLVAFLTAGLAATAAPAAAQCPASETRYGIVASQGVSEVEITFGGEAIDRVPIDGLAVMEFADVDHLFDRV